MVVWTESLAHCGVRMALRVEPGVVAESRRAEFLELVSKELSHGPASELARRAVAEAVESAYYDLTAPEMYEQPGGSGQKRGGAASGGSESPPVAFGAVPPSSKKGPDPGAGSGRSPPRGGGASGGKGAAGAAAGSVPEATGGGGAPTPPGGPAPYPWGVVPQVRLDRARQAGADARAKMNGEIDRVPPTPKCANMPKSNSWWVVLDNGTDGTTGVFSTWTRCRAEVGQPLGPALNENAVLHAFPSWSEVVWYCHGAQVEVPPRR